MDVREWFRPHDSSPNAGETAQSPRMPKPYSPTTANFTEDAKVLADFSVKFLESKYLSFVYSRRTLLNATIRNIGITLPE